MDQKRIAVLCGGRFALPAIQQLGIEKFLCGIAIGKGEKRLVEALKEESTRSGIPFYSFPDKNSVKELAAYIKALQADYVFSISFPFLIPAAILTGMPNRFINFHPGPLPAYRGPMPIFEVLRYEEPTTAVSVHFMNEAFDEGPLIMQEPVPIKTTDTYGQLAVRLSERTALAALNMANMVQFGSVIPSVEQASTGAHYFEYPEPSDTFIDWRHMPATEILALIRACNPWNQGGDAMVRNEPVKLISASLADGTHHTTPGEVLGLTPEGSLAIACLDRQAIHIHIVGSEYGILPAVAYAKLKGLMPDPVLTLS